MLFVYVHYLALGGLLLMLPASYLILRRTLFKFKKESAIALSVLIYIVTMWYLTLSSISIYHSLVICALLTSIAGLVLFHYVDFVGWIYNAYVDYLTDTSVLRKVNLIERNLYYVLFLIMLLKGSFYCGVSQFYKLFGRSLKAYREPGEDCLMSLLKDGYGDVYLKLVDGKPTIPNLRITTSMNFIVYHVINPHQAHFDRLTGLTIFHDIVSAKKFHWLKLFFKP